MAHRTIEISHLTLEDADDSVVLDLGDGSTLEIYGDGVVEVWSATGNKTYYVSDLRTGAAAADE